jgi:tetratricopeptide (TPR) repeat protein
MLAETDFERGFTYSLWANLTEEATGDAALSFARARMAAAFAPQLTSGHLEMMSEAIRLGHDEEALRQALIIPKQRRADEVPTFRERGYTYALDTARYNRGELLGDFASQAGHCRVFCSSAGAKLRDAQSAARLHDIAAARDFLAQAHAIGTAGEVREPRARYYLAAATGDWPAAVRAAGDFAAAIAAGETSAPRIVAMLTANWAAPLRAVAQAETGDFAAAWGTIAATPLDCYACLDARAVIAARQHNRPLAETWFARAIAAAPSIPYAYTDRGTMLLRAGDFDGAIAQFGLAHSKAPDFADPLELWGEALIAKNRSDLALARFAEAARHAPHWGRLHLKWGEALLWSGRKDDAAKQFALAADLYLTAGERAELAHVSHV